MTGLTEIHSYFNPRPPRGGRQPKTRLTGQGSDISIHAPREGGDNKWVTVPYYTIDISIHAPREGGDNMWAGRELNPP